jgi:hypothetical protein
MDACARQQWNLAAIQIAALKEDRKAGQQPPHVHYPGTAQMLRKL